VEVPSGVCCLLDLKTPSIIFQFLFFPRLVIELEYVRDNLKAVDVKLSEKDIGSIGTISRYKN